MSSHHRPCCWQGRDLPDHGEIWTAACELDEDELENGIIATSLDLPRSPFHFTRRLGLEGSSLIVRYRLVNRGPAEESYVWAMHPLLSVEAGDRLELQPWRGTSFSNPLSERDKSF